MNTIRFALAALMAVSTTACTKEILNTVEPIEKPVMVPCCINATADDDTKTHIDGISGGSANVVWDKNDNVSVFSTDKSSHLNNKFTISNINGSTATFTGEVESGTSKIVAFYPYSSALSYSDGIISNAQIPATQAATSGSFAVGSSLSLAKGTRTDNMTSALTFADLCSSLSFVLPSNISATSIVVSSKSGTKMAGKVSVDCSTVTITSASESSVNLTGSFEGGSTYYITIAPGQYDNGFRFVVTTSAGNSYTLETTKNLTAVAGKVYPLGNLTLKMAESDFSSSLSIAHNVSNSTLNGSDAKFSLSVNKAEFASLVKEYSYTVTVKNGSDVVYRQTTASGTTAPVNKVLDVYGSLPYIPKGNYTYTVSLDYKVSNGTKDVVRHVDLQGNATSPQPSGFVIAAEVSGYTSYSCYLGTDGQTASAANANKCDPSTIYNIGATYKSGLSQEVYNQCASMISFSTKLDGKAASGNVGGQSWSTHTITAEGWAFDGASGSFTSSKTVKLTGLPYNVAGSNMKTVIGDGWTFGDDKEYKFESDGYLYMRGRSGSKYSEKTSVSYKGFNVPANINVSVRYKVGLYTNASTQKLIFTVGNTDIIYWRTHGEGWQFITFSDSGAINTSTLTPSANTIYQSVEGYSTSWVGGQSKLQYVSVLYR